MNDFTLAGAIITSPGAAFAELRERPRFLLPLIALVLALVVQQYWYYNIVDFEWFKDLTLSAERYANLAPEQRANAMKAMTLNLTMWSKIIALAVVVPLMMLVVSVYYLLAGKITNVQFTFKHWFAFITWSSIPLFIGLLAGCVILALQGKNAQLDPSELQILSANELFFQLPASYGPGQLLTQLNPITLWTWAVAVIGMKTWSNRSWLFSTVFVMLPSVVVFGIWAWIVL